MEDILNGETVIFLEDKIKETQVGNRIILEIVESEEIGDKVENLFAFIEKMKMLGCRIAIDDFGTGYSNFDYLIKLKADFVKIDGSLIKNLDKEKNSEALVELIVDFANKFNLKTIAEFVHNKDVLRVVKALGVQYSQGFYLAEPVELDI
jgi:EAL domain-containing protein (putative c-di-GMP-specific phosphodiesterase class I)